ncbi:MAG: hypothetical protein EBX40_01155 [Gammaproteobacteria bacterium]|nr:hypothetical protein [Gammaproteobacteria bacterium]
MPQNPFGNSNSPVSKMWQPSDIQMRQFMVLKRASENPMSVLDDIRNGLVNPVSIVALRELYPEIYGHVTKQIQENLLGTEKVIGEDQKAVLAIVLGGNFDETFSPGFIASVTSSVAPPSPASGPPQPSQSQQKMKQSGILKMKMAENTKTQTERVLTRT